MKIAWFFFASLIALQAETVTLTPTKDTDIYSYTGVPTSTTYSLGVSSTPTSSTTLHSQKSLIQFNLSSLTIPATELGSAKLRLFVLDTDPTYGSVSPGNVYVYRQGADWGTISATSPKWSVITPTDYIGKFPVLTTSVNSWVEVDVTNLVISWLTGTANQGLILQPQSDRTDPSLNVNFGAMELSSAGYAPQLVVTRTTTTTAPQLKIFTLNQQITLEWPVVGSSGWTLQWNSNLTGTWQSSTASATVVNGNWRVVPATGLPRAFFRLYHP